MSTASRLLPVALSLGVALLLPLGGEALARMQLEAEAKAQSSRLTVPLSKQYVPVLRNGRAVMHKTAYFGSIYVGTPAQHFTVVFDTGSGHFIVPAGSCASESCQLHRRFDRAASSSAVDLDHDGNSPPPDAEDRDQVSVAFGTGDIVGEFARETACLGLHPPASGGAGGAELEGLTLPENGSTVELPGTDCTRVRVVFATEMTSEPFSAFEFDGVLGLGLEALALDPEFSFMGQMTKLNKAMEPSFGVFVSADDRVASEITFGGYDSHRVAAGEELRWADVHKPELGYWLLRLRSVRIGGETLELCSTGDCTAIADTGTSLLGVPQQAAQHIHWLLARDVEGDPGEMDCRSHPGPDIVFDLGGFNLTLTAEEYSRPAGLRVVTNATNETQFICRAQLLPVDEGPALGDKAWILGEPLLRRYYSAYDWASARIGFAPSAQPSPEDAALEPPRHAIVGAPAAEPPTPTVVYI